MNKKCIICENEFVARNSTYLTCSPECSRERSLRAKRADYKANREAINEKNRKNYNKHRERILAQKKEYSQRPEVRARKNELARKRRRENPAVKLREKVYGLVHYGLKKGGGVASFTWDALPYTPEQLKEHLESQFDDQMTWENHGTYWHLDHIIPSAALPFSSLDDENFHKCWSLDNLQPLEKTRNMSKGSLHEGQRHTFENNKK